MSMKRTSSVAFDLLPIFFFALEDNVDRFTEADDFFAGGAGNGAHVTGSDPGLPRDRLSFAYAAACAAHLAGESETCGEILANVLACGGCTPSAIAADEDLVGLRQGLWGGGA